MIIFSMVTFQDADKGDQYELFKLAETIILTALF